MAIERRFSPEIETAFVDWIKVNGIQVALFDLDDTLLDTNKLFTDQEEKFMEYCKNCIPELDMKTFKEKFGEFNNLSFKLVGASPKKWSYIVSEMVKIYGEKSLVNGLQIFDEIYSSAPDIFEGVDDILRLYESVGIRLGLVTHAGAKWTDIKLDKHNLREYFEHIEIIDVDEHKYKGPEHWQQAIDFFGVSPSNVMVTGDNVNGDILAAHSLGVRTLAWLPSKWHVYREGKLPDGVYVVDKIENLIHTLIINK